MPYSYFVHSGSFFFSLWRSGDEDRQRLAFFCAETFVAAVFFFAQRHRAYTRCVSPPPGILFSRGHHVGCTRANTSQYPASISASTNAIAPGQAGSPCGTRDIPVFI